MVLLEASGDGWRVVCAKESDRWSHRIDPVMAGQPAPGLLTSIEGTDRDPWPRSPPFQELVIQPRPADSSTRQITALLLGRAGTAHWSASVELLVDPPRVVIDAACRVHQVPGFLGSTYQCSAPLELGSNATIRLGPTRADCSVTLIAERGEIASVTRLSGVIAICPKPIVAPNTARWRYHLKLVR
jgi:hypothetical protein